MDNQVIELIRQNRDACVTEMVARIVDEIPRYALVDPTRVRQQVEAMFDPFTDSIEQDDVSQLTRPLTELSTRRVAEGFSIAEFAQALLIMPTVARRVVRQAGPKNDALFAKSFAIFEQRLVHIITAGMNIFSSQLLEQSEGRAARLAQERAQFEGQMHEAQRATETAQRALAVAQQLNSRVVASLSSGVLVLQEGTRRVLLWSPRMATITGIPPAEAEGKEALAVITALKGVPADEIIASVRAIGHYPMRKLQLTLKDGTRRWVFLQAEALRGSGPDGPGVVVTIDDVTEREMLIDSFSRYVSKEVVQKLLSHAGTAEQLGGERRTCSVLFADIRGFTGLSERTSLEQLHVLLNQYFRVMIHHVTAREGVIDKFIGDKIMAVFSHGSSCGAPEAVGAAVAIQQAIAELNAQRRSEGHEPIEVGIGVNTGEVVMGTVGSEERMSFTVIGDAVNVADRLQSLAAAGEVLVGSATAERAGADFTLEPLGERALRGRKVPQRVFRATALR